MAVAPPDRVAAVVHALKQAWRDGAPPDAAAAVRAHPELLANRSLAADLAYEEYCLRDEAGDPPDPDEFCDRLPAFRSYVREVIRGHRAIADNPDLFDAAPVWPEPGDPFEGLTVVRELGRGSFARAYLARDPDAGGRPVVLKLSPGRSGEAATLGPLRHPNVVGVLWARATAGGLFAVCMPYAGAVTLADAVGAAFAGGRRPRTGSPLAPADDPDAPADPVAGPLATGREGYPDAVAAVFARLADAVGYLHRRGVGHGDLKPSNVLLGPGGHPSLIDFNLSTTAADSPLRAGGTLPYMPPERLRQVADAPPADVDPAAADVYAFGAVLFEALAGRVPYPPAEGMTVPAAAADLLARVLGGDRRRLGRGELPRPLRAVAAGCLDPDPRARPSIAAVGRRLDRYRRRWARRRTAAVAAAVLVVVGAIAWRTAGPSIGPPSAAVLAGANEYFARGKQYLRANDVRAARDDFDRADRGRTDGEPRAYLGYCESVGGRHASAEALYKNAIDRGYAPAWVRNNLAFAIIQSRGTADRFQMAVEEATAALAVDPGLDAARLNRAAARLGQATEGGPAGPDPQPVADIEAAMQRGPFPVNVYVIAASVLVTFGGREHESRAADHLARAVRLGYPVAAVERDPLFRRLSSTPFPRLREVEQGRAGGGPSAAEPRLVRPPLD